MNPLNILFIIENFVFYALVLCIAWMGKSAPPYVFMGLFVFLIYWLIRTVVTLQGMDRNVAFYSINSFIIIFLLYSYLH